MLLRYKGNGSPPLVGNKVISRKGPTKLSENYTHKLKEYINRGYEFSIRVNGEWVDAEDYLFGDNLDSVEETSEITVTDDNPYEELFEGHWRTQVSNVKDYTDNVKELESILEYAKNNDVTDGVINRIEDYIEELQR